MSKWAKTRFVGAVYGAQIERRFTPRKLELNCFELNQISPTGVFSTSTLAV